MNEIKINPKATFPIVVYYFGRMEIKPSGRVRLYF